MRAKLRYASLLLALASSITQAHTIYLECNETGAQIDCKGGYSDGSAVSNTPVEVLSYDEELLIAGNTDADSRFSFARPEQDFFILMDAGPGHVVELDMLDIAN